VKEPKKSGVSANVGKTAPLTKNGQVDQLAIPGGREGERERGRERGKRKKGARERRVGA
jgi:hypothetical protein